jgi:hypothetical protein
MWLRTSMGTTPISKTQEWIQLYVCLHVLKIILSNEAEFLVNFNRKQRSPSPRRQAHRRHGLHQPYVLSAV